MLFNTDRPWYLLALAALLIGVPLAIYAQQADDEEDYFTSSPYLRIDPEKIVTTASLNPCGECHKQELAVLDTTAHADGFEVLHTRDRARSILKAMDLTVAKRESLCLKCHYTAVLDDGVAKAVAGVSCESCHGAARDWIEVHDDVRDARAAGNQQEVERLIQTSVANGMLRPSSNVYGVAANCFECHTVPHEALINQGGHKSGSVPFNLVERYRNIKHNFVEAQRGGPEHNRPLTPERVRLLFVVGRMLNYEYGIRGVARATNSDGSYLTSMVNRTDDAFIDLEDILLTLQSSNAEIPEITQILRIGKEAELKPNNAAALRAVADRLRTLGQQFGSRYDGSELAALDPLIAGEPPPRRTPAVTPQPPQEVAEVRSEDEAESPDQPQTPPAESQTATAVGPVVNPPAWFPKFQHAFTQPGCNCHKQAVKWLKDDRHGRAAAPFLANHPAAVQIATVYGLSAEQMSQAGSLCMNCHSTYSDRSVGRTVRGGITCEGCHGPAEKYIDTHEEGENPRDGMHALKTAEGRAQNCSRCHYVTDQRLLSAGHPAGEDYDIVEASEQIVHWPDDRNVERNGAYPAVSAEALRSALQKIKQSRPVPGFTPVEPAQPPPVARFDADEAGGEIDSEPAPVAATTVEWDDWDSSFSESATEGPGTADPYRSPLSAVSDSSSTEEILLILKRRLQQLYRAR